MIDMLASLLIQDLARTAQERARRPMLDQVLHVSAAWDGMEFLNMKAQHDELRAWALLRQNKFSLHSALAPRCLFRHGLPQHTDDF